VTKVFSSVDERFVNPLFEVFDGGDFILSSWRDIEEPLAEIRIFFEEKEMPSGAVDEAVSALKSALEIVGADSEVKVEPVPDEDWKLAYRRHFKTEKLSERIYTVPEWEAEEFFASGKLRNGEIAIVIDPGMAFGTGKHETTKACLGFIDQLSSAIVPHSSFSLPHSFLDMGCGSGILSIAAKKLGFAEVEGFDVDQEAVDASIENAAKNGVEVGFRHFALGRNDAAANPPERRYEVVAANILGPLLIRFADEIVGYVGDRLIISGILTELYPEVLAAYVARGFEELDRRTIGEWTTGLLRRV